MNWFEIKSQQGANGETDVFIFDEIGCWGVSADQLINEVQRMKPTSINLHINSPGGSITDGWAIFNFLRAHSARVTVYIDSMAASIAGVIAMAGDEVIMAEASLFHMHLPGLNGYIAEKVDGLEDIVIALRKMDEIIRGIYKRRTGASDEQLAEWFSGETYFTPEEALKHGLIDSIVERVRMVACAAKWEPKSYGSVNKAMQSNNLNGGHHGGVQPSRNQNQKEDTEMSKELEQRIATLEAEAKLKDNAIADFTAKSDGELARLEAAKKEGSTEALASEETRRKAIVALRDKYNAKGDLDAIALTAIADGKTADDFKDEVLEAVSKRPTSVRAEDTVDGDGNDAPEKQIDKLRAQMNKETDPIAKGKLAKQLKELRNK